MSSETGIAILIGLGIGLGILALFFGIIKLTRRRKATKPSEKVGMAILPEVTFQLKDLVISPAEAREGEKVSISFKVSNVSNTRALIRRAVKINGVEIGNIDLELAPGETQLATFFVEENAPGEYKVEVGDLKGSFVIAPPKLCINTLDIMPRQVQEGGKVDIAAEVANTGGTAGMGKLEVRLRGNVLLSKEVTVPPGKSEKVSVSLSNLEPGIYEIRIGDFKDTFVVQMSDHLETL